MTCIVYLGVNITICSGFPNVYSSPPPPPFSISLAVTPILNRVCLSVLFLPSDNEKHRLLSKVKLLMERDF